MPRRKKIITETEKTSEVESTGKEGAVSPKKIVNVKVLAGLMLFFVFAGMVFFGGYFYVQYKKALEKTVTDNPSESQVLGQKIRQFVELPVDEDPTIAEVKDLEKLKGQAFFSFAQNGDKVLIYSKNKKAVLYRPGTEKIIEVTSLKTNSEAQSDLISSAATEAPVVPATLVDEKEEGATSGSEDYFVAQKQEIAAKIVVLNGTGIKGLAAGLADRISQEVVGVEISQTGNSVGDYTQTIVVDLTGNNSELVKKIIALVGGKTGELPDEEEKPEGDILVIGGEK